MCTAVSPHSTKTYKFGDSKFLLCVPCDRLETIQPLCASPKRPFEVLSHLHQHFIYTFMSFIWRFSPVVYQRGAPGDRQKSCLRRQTVFILNGALIRSKSDINYMQSIYSVFSLALYHAICCRMQNWFHSKVQTHLLAWQADPADQTWLHAAVWIRSSPGCDPGNKNCKHLIYIWLITYGISILLLTSHCSAAVYGVFSPVCCTVGRGEGSVFRHTSLPSRYFRSYRPGCSATDNNNWSIVAYSTMSSCVTLSNFYKTNCDYQMLK